MNHLRKYNESSIFDKKNRDEIRDIANKIKDSFLYITDDYKADLSNNNYAYNFYSYLIDIKLLRSDNIDTFLDLLYQSIDKCKFELDVHITSFIKTPDRNIFLLGEDDKLNILKAFINNKVTHDGDYITIRVIIK